MTALINNYCSILTIDTLNWNTENQNISLEITVDDSDTYFLAIDTDNEDPYEITAEDLDIEELPAGIYFLKLMITQSNGNSITETVCLPVLCKLQCELNPLYVDIKNFNKIIAFEALKASTGCFDCSCSTMLKLYGIINPNITDCGCE